MMICSWARLINPNVSETHQSSWSGSSVFALEKWSKYLSFFTSNRPFDGYFQWNACTYFHKICNWTRCSDAKLIKSILNFLVALLRFYFRKFTLKSKPSRVFCGYFQWNACTFFQKICSWTRYSDAKLIKHILNFLITLLRFCLRKRPKNLNF